MIDGLDHLQIAMPAGGEDQARAFYGDLLGLSEIPKPEELRARGGCWFRGGGVELHIGVQADFQPALKAHPGFRTIHFEALHEQFGGEIDTKIPGVRRIFVADPFGNRIEIGEYVAYGPCPSLLVNDLTAALPWYIEKLGFQKTKLLKGPPPGVLLERDGMPLLLEQTEGDISKRPASNVDPYGLDALYVVRDVAALFEELHGKPIPEGAKDFMVKSPEGYILVFTGSL